MNKPCAVLLGIALFAPVFLGCQSGEPMALGGVEVLSVKLADWTNPEDGKVYVVALPTWKNGGSEDIRQVTFIAGLKLENVVPPKNEHAEPQYHGSAVEPGTIVESMRIPEDGVILGVKADLPNLTEDSVSMSAIGSKENYVPPKKSDA